MKRNLFLLTTMFAAGLIIVSCDKNSSGPKDEPATSMEQLQVSDQFDWATTRTSTFRITALDNQDQPIVGAKFYVYSANPDEGGDMIVSGITDDQGVYQINYQVPTYYHSLYVATNYLGLVNGTEVELTPQGFDLVLGGSSTPEPAMKGSKLPTSTNSIFKFLGTYHSVGIPDYLEPVNDPITSDFLADINNTLPEQVRLDVSHPEYFSDVYDHNLRLVETCDVWVTFVTEGAGYTNILGFYTYETGNEPSSPDDIDTITIIFPNASLSGSGGGLQPGNKVKIGRFNAGTSIGWALMADGWKNGVTAGKWIVYSNKNLNQATNPALRQQTVLLHDPGRERLLLGIEDILRSNSGCDHDFNDAVFYITANPIQAIDLTDLPTVDYTGDDDDADGVPDNFDDYPNDANKAFDNFFFTQGNFGTLAFEDLWPYKGDYDFNDAVVDYNFNQITNGANKLVQLDATFILRAHGAYYHNGFGFELPVSPDKIGSISGTQLSGDYVSVNTNGTEAGQDKAVVIVWEDSYDILTPLVPGIGANTTPNVPFIVPDTLRISIVMSDPIPMNEMGVPPYNPFIIVDGQREIEVHLPNHAPTTLADLSLLGTGHDDSSPSSGRYYKTDNNLPWAINIVERFEYPKEKIEVIGAYLKFAEWAESGGTLYPDWYRDENGYRDETKIYVPEN